MNEGKKPVLLVIRDGWGANHHKEQDAYNAIKLADTPVSDNLSQNWPRTELAACGLDVGVPLGVMGNSEVGHQNIGAGRIVDQEIVRINKAFETGSIRGNKVLEGAFDRSKDGGKLHYMGIVSDAGVHGLLDHLYGLLGEAKNAGIEQVYIHAFTDGRDTPPHSGKGFIEQIEAKCSELGIGKIASVCGRFWCMDRDNRWDRVSKAYNMLVGKRAAGTSTNASKALSDYYDSPTNDSSTGDEFVPPTSIVDETGKPVANIGNGDAVVFYNYRGDRPREITRAFIEDEFSEFERGEKLDLYYVAMTEWKKGLCENVIFLKPKKMSNILGNYLSSQGLTQYRCAETEKYPHVTFFFNDYTEEPFEGEAWGLANSPKVDTYDETPEMSAEEVKELTKNAILSRKYDFVLVNFANPDMVGHTGNIEAVKLACVKVDHCIGELLEAIDQVNGVALVTADHGNSDQMWDPAVNGPHTAHTLNPVELVIYGKDCENLSLFQEDRRLADIAPTVLELMGLEKPAEMTGISLIVK
ncbi:2,3-bisphosphoglycerate-independent phosphoglycerate mutase [Candidatus Pelagisphaera phototrophica]|uniref:2,3-bisphosphoglycerate-independent phosphoglycerate mutase n=1 Tax=Candidatus Pelagisphaera phototrophica TaxID=2684113 RepID=UPI001A08EBA1|nr:2,3-bisphosphoglycerate-independent phosphoglycerate mutase [Candidatus Pelagisphaera phototrophica]QXD31653.1 2,3-bisphosphoglycerate-independent phosphoglycerate mutase [Candidatus Pelagisphaera phototrophica]